MTRKGKSLTMKRQTNDFARRGARCAVRMADYAFLLVVGACCLAGCDNHGPSAPRGVAAAPAAWSLKVAATPLEVDASRALTQRGNWAVEQVAEMEPDFPPRLISQQNLVSQHGAPRENLPSPVRGEVLLDPPLFYLPCVRGDRPATAEGILSSPQWDHFTIKHIESSIPGLQWKLQPAKPEWLESRQAHSGYRLQVTLPRNMPAGNFKQWLRMTVKPAVAVAAAKQLTIPIEGKVLRPISVYGQGIDATGTIQFGILPAGIQHQKHLIVKVYDDDPRLVVRAIQVEPKFLDVQLQPYGKSEGVNNLYRLTVALPATAPACVYRIQRLGKIHIMLTHPRLQQLSLRVDFVLQDNAAQRLVHLASDR